MKIRRIKRRRDRGIIQVARDMFPRSFEIHHFDGQTRSIKLPMSVYDSLAMLAAQSQLAHHLKAHLK